VKNSFIGSRRRKELAKDLAGLAGLKQTLSLKRLSFDEAQGQVIYQYEKYSTESEHMDYLEFIAR